MSFGQFIEYVTLTAIVGLVILHPAPVVFLMKALSDTLTNVLRF